MKNTEIERLNKELDACSECMRRADRDIEALTNGQLVHMATIENLEAQVKELRSAIKAYENYVDRIIVWKDEGEKIMDAAKQWPLFKFATWWADRPWRTSNGIKRP